MLLFVAVAVNVVVMPWRLDIISFVAQYSCGSSTPIVVVPYYIVWWRLVCANVYIASRYVWRVCWLSRNACAVIHVSFHIAVAVACCSVRNIIACVLRSSPYYRHHRQLSLLLLAVYSVFVLCVVVLGSLYRKHRYGGNGSRMTAVNDGDEEIGGKLGMCDWWRQLVIG